MDWTVVGLIVFVFIASGVATPNCGILIINERE